MPAHAAFAVRLSVRIGFSVAGSDTGVGEKAKMITLTPSVKVSLSASTSVTIDALKADGTFSVFETYAKQVSSNTMEKLIAPTFAPLL